MLLQIAPLEWAVLPQAVAILVEEVRQRRPAKIAAFNVAQNVLMLVLARLVMDAVEGNAHDPSELRQLAAVGFGALVYVVVNNVLTGTIMALTAGTGVLGTILAGMKRETPVTPIVLGLAPMFAASLEFSIWTAPLCLFLIMAVRTAAKVSTEHEIAALHDARPGCPTGR